MKTFTFNVNGFFKGQVQARTLWGAKRKIRAMYERMFAPPIENMVVSVGSQHMLTRARDVLPGRSSFCTKTILKIHLFLCNLTIDFLLVLWYNISVKRKCGKSKIRSMSKTSETVRQ